MKLSDDAGIASASLGYNGTCPRCGHKAPSHQPWPYLKGSIPGGEDVTWYRCSMCSTLFSGLTEVTDVQHENRQPG
jgi:DNA-directed RNA polymerase subunit RPC12/RpoP